MAHRIGAAVLAGLVLAAPAAWAQGQERCYGVARAGENDGIGNNDTAGGSTVDFQGDAWKWVPAGTCLTLPLPQQPDGTPRRGALEPLDRDRS